LRGFRFGLHGEAAGDFAVDGLADEIRARLASSQNAVYSRERSGWETRWNLLRIYLRSSHTPRNIGYLNFRQLHHPLIRYLLLADCVHKCY